MKKTEALVDGDERERAVYIFLGNFENFVYFLDKEEWDKLNKWSKVGYNFNNYNRQPGGFHAFICFLCIKYPDENSANTERKFVLVELVCTGQVWLSILITSYLRL